MFFVGVRFVGTQFGILGPKLAAEIFWVKEFAPARLLHTARTICVAGAALASGSLGAFVGHHRIRKERVFGKCEPVSMIDRVYEVWARVAGKAKTYWRWISYGLTLVALVYVVGILYLGGLQVREVNWAAYWEAGLVSFGLYFISLVAQFSVWARMLSFHHQTGWRDVEIYARMMLLRRLPGGIWQWVGRTAMYSATTQVPTRVVAIANLWEWGILILVGVSVFLTGLDGFNDTLRMFFSGIAIVAALTLAVLWQPRSRIWILRLVEALVWVGLYGAAWLLGGAIIYFFVRAAGGLNLDWVAAWRLWALTGVVSLIIAIVPAVIGAQEVTLTFILQPFLSLSTALLVALLIRLLFTLSDVVWGLGAWGVSAAILSKRSTSQAQPVEHAKT
jgi:hypothetical protein